jgi:hypothetical protein
MYYIIIYSIKSENALEALRRIRFTETQLARAQVITIHSRLLKVGTIITRNIRRIWLPLNSSFPLPQLFCSCLANFDPWAVCSVAPGIRKTTVAYPWCFQIPRIDPRWLSVTFHSTILQLLSSHFCVLQSYDAKNRLKTNQKIVLKRNSFYLSNQDCMTEWLSCPC